MKYHVVPNSVAVNVAVGVFVRGPSATAVPLNLSKFRFVNRNGDEKKSTADPKYGINAVTWGTPELLEPPSRSLCFSRRRRKNATATTAAPVLMAAVRVPASAPGHPSSLFISSSGSPTSPQVTAAVASYWTVLYGKPADERRRVASNKLAQQQRRRLCLLCGDANCKQARDAPSSG